MAADSVTPNGRPGGAERVDPLLRAFSRLCALLDRPAGEAELRGIVTVPPTGADIPTLTTLAGRLGFETREQPAKPRALRDLPTPFLVVGADGSRPRLVRGRTDRHLVVVDGMSGVSRAALPGDVAAAGDRILSITVPAEDERVPAWRRRLWRKLAPAMWQIGLASVVINLLALATPLFMMTVYNKVINHGATRTLDVLAIGMVTLLLFELALRSLRGYLTAHTGARVDAALGGSALHHLLRLPYRQFEANASGSILERLRQGDQVRQFLSSNLPLLVVDLGFIGLFVAALFWISAPLAVLTLVAMPVFVLLSIVAHRRQRALARAQQKAAAARQTALGEIVSNALTVKSLALEPEMEARCDGRLLASAWTGFVSARAGHLVGSLAGALQQATALLVVYVGARLIIVGDLQVGGLVAAAILSARALAPLRQVAQALGQLQDARAALAGLDELLAETERDGRTLADRTPLEGALCVEEVTFRYGERRAAALDRVTLRVEPGTTLGVIGAPGSGKSTLVKLLLGLERPDSGRVLLGETDIGRLPPSAYRQRIGVVPQEIQLFAGTIAENIAMAADDRSLARVVAAAKFVGAHEFIERLPEGYETRLGERGTGLSTGQRQLVGIARALVRNPKILILDEATSALDDAAEALLLRNLKRAGKGRIVVLVTHQPSTLAICGRAILLEEGRIAADGPPVAVLARARPRGGEAGRPTTALG